MARSRSATGEGHTWDRLDSGPADADRTVLLLPGGMCTARQYREVMAEPALADVHLVAVTLPGHGGTPALDDVTVECSAGLVAELAEEIACDVVVGFSMGANVALEMAAAGAYACPLILLAPSFSREDEARFLRVLDHLGRVLGHWPYSAMLKMVDAAVKDSPLPDERRAELVADLKRNDPRWMRRAFHTYLGYLDDHESVAPRLSAAGVPAWVVHGESGDGGVTDSERKTLEACANIVMITLPGASFFTPNEVPALVADLVNQAFQLTA